jgi:hypothetical protein
MLNEHLGEWLQRWRLRKIDLESVNQVGVEARLPEANCLVSNNPEDEYCYPMIDLDCVAFLIPSTHNQHLIIQKLVDKKKYRAVLVALKEAGLYQQGCIDNFDKAGFTALRLPWIIKEEKESGEQLPQVQGATP